jgi:hypothetical protein
MDIRQVNDPEDAIRGEDDDPRVREAVAYATWVAATLAFLCGYAFGLLVVKVGDWL